MWSLIGDVAWILGWKNGADLAYSQAVRSAERAHARAASTPILARVHACPNPDCHWLLVTSDQAIAMVEYAQHECPEEAFEEEEEW